MREFNRAGEPQQYEEFGRRDDSMGLFWSEPKKIQPPKVVRVAPEPTWLDDDFLPNLDVALAWVPDLMTSREMWLLISEGDKFIFDIECYSNYFLIMFKSVKTGKIMIFEQYEGFDLATHSLESMCRMVCLIGFKSNTYDIPLLTLAMTGLNCEQLYTASRMLTSDDMQPHEVLKEFRTKKIRFDSIDLIEVAPLKGSLKEYGGRLHTTHMQDLPFAFDRPITGHFDNKRTILKYYCNNDLINTYDLYRHLEKPIDRRVAMGQQYKIDLRSKSDAQIAESVIKSEYKARTGRAAFKPEIIPFTVYKYQTPDFISFDSELMKWVLNLIEDVDFTVGEKGKLMKDERLTDLHFTINKTSYNMGLGGLHSIDSNLFEFAADDEEMCDIDVESYYPFAIINSGFYPEHLGADVVKEIFIDLVTTRLDAKHSGDKEKSNELKITINGFFGKLSDVWSVIYSPRSMMQVTITGQLSLLMLIEDLESVGISVISANTDGIVTKYKKSRRDEVRSIVSKWQDQTKFKMEYSMYKALLARDVNNYMAVTDSL